MDQATQTQSPETSPLKVEIFLKRVNNAILFRSTHNPSQISFKEAYSQEI